jgi:hypothetical protein
MWGAEMSGQVNEELLLDDLDDAKKLIAKYEWAVATIRDEMFDLRAYYEGEMDEHCHDKSSCEYGIAAARKDLCDDLLEKLSRAVNVATKGDL